MHATRAVMCDFAPDYAAGITLNYKINNQWTNKFQINNGWQVLQEQNKYKGFANVLVYQNHHTRNLFNFGLFYTTESADNSKAQPRYYSNNFAKLYFGKWVVAPMVDIGFQKAGNLTQNYTSEDETLMWYACALSLRYELTSHFGVAGRYERINDKHGIVPEIYTGTANGFNMFGTTLTLEYLPSAASVVRLEARHKHSEDAIFLTDKRDERSTENVVLYLSFAIFLSHE